MLASTDRAPSMVVGFHGCHARTADRLLAGDPFRLSRNDYDWLGTGAYFWEYAPFRALEWASERFGGNACVLRADISLGECLNLLDIAHAAGLTATYAQISARFVQTGKPLPSNRRGRNELDRLVLDGLVADFQIDGGVVDTIRGCFAEGEPLYPGSRVLSKTHVQIAVRTLECISNLSVVNFG